MFLVNPIVCSTVSSICWTPNQPGINHGLFPIWRNNCVSQPQAEASADEVQRRWGELTRELEIAALSPRDPQGSPGIRDPPIPEITFFPERSKSIKPQTNQRISKDIKGTISWDHEKRTAGCTLQFEHLIFACQTISTPENAVKSHNWSSCCHFHLNPNSHGQSQMYHVSWFIPSLMVN